MTATQRDLVVIAIGGNSLISARDKKSVADQYDAICATVAHIADVIESGRRVVITHGNGPQVGFILLRSEIARKNSDLHSVPLVSCVADTQGANRPSRLTRMTRGTVTKHFPLAMPPAISSPPTPTASMPTAPQVGVWLSPPISTSPGTLKRSRWIW